MIPSYSISIFVFKPNYLAVSKMFKYCYLVGVALAIYMVKMPNKLMDQIKSKAVYYLHVAHHVLSYGINLYEKHFVKPII